MGRTIRTAFSGGMALLFLFLLLNPPEALPIEGELSEGLWGSLLNHNFLTVNNIHAALHHGSYLAAHEVVDDG